MNYEGILILLLGHALGDFYFQSDAMAENKKVYSQWLLYHAAIYSVCMGSVLFLCAAPSFSLILLWCSSSICHALIDHLKILINKSAGEKINTAVKWFSRYDFFIDQILHLITIFLMWIFIYRYAVLNVYSHVELSISSVRLLPLITGLLYLLKPAGMLIGRVLAKYKKAEDDNGHQNAGRLIGYLERFIVFTLIIYQQYGAIAFVIAAKSLARFQDINDKRQTAEYYLIGTLLSVVSAFIAALLLGFGSNV